MYVAFIRTLALALALFPALAQAQVGGLMFPGPGVPQASGAAFTGMADIVASPTACWSLRACSAATRGNRAINLCDPVGITCVDVLTDATTGAYLNNAGTLNGTNCNTLDTCIVKIFYDQTTGGNCTGSCDLVAGSLGTTPALKHSCIGSLACVFFGGGNQLVSAGSMTQAQPMWVSAVARQTVSGSFGTFFGSAVTTGMGVGGGLSADTAFMTNGTLVTTAATNASSHAFQFLAKNTTSSIQVDGAAPVVQTTGVGTISGTIAMSEFGSGNFLTGFIFEVAIWNGDQSGSNNSMHTNQSGYWGTP